MNFFLSIFLCFALALSGTAGLPAEPETATTWTLRNLTLFNGEDTISLDPELRITTAAGEDKVMLHFEIGSGEDTLLPITAELTRDALTFSLCEDGHAYTLSNDDLMSLIAPMDEEEMLILDIVSDFLVSYGSLIGALSGNDELLLVYDQAITDALIKTCGGEYEPVEIEIDGETISAQQMELHLTLDSTIALLDELRLNSFSEMETILDAMLRLINIDADEEFASFTDLAEYLKEEAGEYDDEIVFDLPAVLTTAETDELSYALVELALDMGEAGSIQVHEEVVTRGEETTLDMSMVSNDIDGTSSGIQTSGILYGPVYAPTAMHVTCDMDIATAIYYDGGDDDPYTSTSAIRLTIDSATEDGLESMVCTMDVIDDDTTAQVTVNSNEVREDDGSVTEFAEILLASDELSGSLSFERNKAESAYADPFEGAEMFDISAVIAADALDPDDPVAEALMEDISQLGDDVSLLMEDESIQTIMMLGGPDASETYDDDYDYEYGYQQVDSLEEAAGIFEGVIPDFTTPEGFEITNITVDEYFMNVEYESEESGFEITLYNDASSMASYTFAGGKLSEKIDDIVVQIRTFDGTYLSDAELTLPDGSTVSIYFYGNPSLEEVEAILAGFNG